MHPVFFITKRYTQKHTKQTLVYRLSRLSCYSTALATTILLLVLSTMNGMEKLFSSLFYAYTVALRIETKTKSCFYRDNELKEKIKRMINVTDVVEVLETTALVGLNGKQAITVIKGFSNNFTESDFYKKSIRMDATSFLDPSDNKYKAIIGTHIGKLLQLDVIRNHTMLTFFYPKRNASPHSINQPYTYRCKKLAAGGLFSIEPKIDSKYIITPIGFLEDLTDRKNQRSYWEVVLRDETKIKSTQQAIQQILPKELKMSNRYQQNECKNRAILIEKLFVYFIFSLIVLLTSFHLFFMLCMIILAKKKDIAILSLLGITQNQIGRIYFYNGLLVSLEGILYGLCTAFTMCFLQQKFKIVHFIKLKTAGAISYPMDIHACDFIYTAILAICVGILASLWPMKRAMALTQHNQKIY
ncbi:FtsX-like permease family protein [Cardinium endosymbiont of Culicoides punctatus]|uniref:FtsX-like permease family protein n=1 Tax=Cardinium endosymbiont of Culicoides punctatus TaxID=2304601 RepID=UPI001058C838|nr:FtsX-like permease family protein [Cardinium endosymbiont of Culicoides punctatus]TDG93355.1 Lipoprotein-releasing system transmembrane protein LolC [Cardinium endosymbiont of Culicoides punctatus]